MYVVLRLRALTVKATRPAYYSTSLASRTLRSHPTAVDQDYSGPATGCFDCFPSAWSALTACSRSCFVWTQTRMESRLHQLVCLQRTYQSSGPSSRAKQMLGCRLPRRGGAGHAARRQCHASARGDQANRTRLHPRHSTASARGPCGVGVGDGGVRHETKVPTGEPQDVTNGPVRDAMRREVGVAERETEAT